MSRKCFGKLPDIYWIFPGELRVMENSKKCCGTFPDMSLICLGKIQQPSRTYLGKFKDMSWRCSGNFRTSPEMSGNCPEISGTFQELSKKSPIKVPIFFIGKPMTTNQNNTRNPKKTKDNPEKCGIEQATLLDIYR